jgi:branched-chain amino acid transport system substrate-binding protein
MLIAIPAALALLVAGCSSGKSSTASPTTSPTTKAATASVIPVGVVGSYSGEEANAEASAEYTIKAWADPVNAAGGLDGHPIKLYVEDDAGNVATSLTQVKILVEEDHVVAIVGQATTNAASWAPYVQSMGIPVVGGNTVDLEYLSNPDFYNVGGNLLSGFYGITALAAKNGPKMGALYCAELPACAAVTSLLNGFGKSLGVSVAYSAGVSSTAAEFTAPCLGLKDSGVQSYDLAIATALVGRVAAECTQLGLKAQMIQPSTADSTLPGNPAFNGVAFTDNIIGFFVDSTPATEAFHAALRQYAPSVGTAEIPLNVAAMDTWASGMLFEAAVQASGATTVTPASIKTGLYALKGDTLGGLTQPLTFTPGMPSLHNCYFSYSIEGGKYVTPTGLTPSCAPNAVIAAVAAKL